ncbi:transglutaminase-like cysteine peptidase [Rhizobium sp. L1K21]|uniref:transglutaminase-like cysteine peptidase n=1 Tax=Rhizobium sp. L1K21 TaxID=2954933 RepID=UPI0020938EEA|nr:transglutaminase-like cysteine peptidase [Rhizobium sp. L1K21]MCO6186117.1 transglutaminase-like cysteine peptidase [Rhizobium sp. L1K21]
MTKRKTTGFIFGLVTAFVANSAYALPANIPVIGATNPPIGHYEFCKTYSNECGPTRGSKSPLHLQETNWREVVKINYQVNTAITPMTDEEIYGVDERWAYPRSVGDCEDYALLKRKLLIEAGIPASDLLMTVVLQPNGDGHAVLTLRTDRGDFVLDNMRDKILLWSETEYRFIKRQDSDNSGKWVKLRDGRVNAVASIN